MAAFFGADEWVKTWHSKAALFIFAAFVAVFAAGIVSGGATADGAAIIILLWFLGIVFAFVFWVLTVVSCMPLAGTAKVVFPLAEKIKTTKIEKETSPPKKKVKKKTSPPKKLTARKPSPKADK